MTSRREKIVKRLLSSLNTKKPDGTPGPLLRERTISYSKKDRKRKGRDEARLIHPQMKWSEVQEEGIEPEKYWNDWVDARDSWRMNTATDQLYHKWKGSGPRKEEIYTQNNKLRKLIRIREAKLKHKKESINNDD
jgi:hypothetical protein